MRWISLVLLNLLAMPVWAGFDEGVLAYEQGNYADAVREFTVTARFGDTSAQYNLGIMYARGEGVKQDYAGAFYWFLKAARHGDSEAQFHIGDMYENGLGVQQNYTEAVKWYRRTAEQGMTVAQLSLGGLYGIGLGAPQSYAEAYAWFSLAAEQGNDSAVQGKEITIDAISPEQLAAAQEFTQTISKKYRSRR